MKILLTIIMCFLSLNAYADCNFDNEITNPSMINEKLRCLNQMILEKNSAFLEKVKNLEEKFDEKIKAIENEYNNKIEMINKKSEIKELPVGTIVASVLNPTQFKAQLEESQRNKWKLADGSEVLNTKFSNVYSKSIPDIRGMFLRGLNYGRNDGVQDPSGSDRTPGSYQSDEIKSHSHPFNGNVGTVRWGVDRSVHMYNPTKSNTDLVGGNETRPKNIAVFWYIKIE